MARVPDMFEELHSCYSENEGFISDIDQVSLSQESFYPSSSPHHKENLAGLEPSEKTYQLTLEECAAAPAAQRKTKKKKKKEKKKKQLSVRHPIDNDYLLNISRVPEKDNEVIKYKSASFTFQEKMEYEFQSFITRQVLMDQDSRAVLRKGRNLRYVPLQGMTSQDLFDIGRYLTLSRAPNNRIAVTIRLSDTHLYVAAKQEMEPVELQEFPELPSKIDGSKSPLLFYWTETHSYSTFASVANPDLYLATTSIDDQLVIMAKGPSALTHFLVSEG